MLDCSTFTEQDWKNSIKEAFGSIDDNLQIFTVKRSYNSGSYYTAVLALRVTVDNEEIIRAVIKMMNDTDREFMFLGSEVDLNGGSIEIDYIQVSVKINI